MNRIDGIITKIYDNEMIDFGEKLTDEQQKRILQKTLDKVKAIPEKSNGKKKRLIFALVAVLTFATMTVMATERVNWDILLSKIIGTNVENSQYLDGMWTMINQTKEDADVEIKLVSAIGDKSNLYLRFDITFPQGTDMSKHYHFYDVRGSKDIWWGDDALGGIYSWEVIDDSHLEDNTVSWALKIQASESDLSNKKIKILLKDIIEFTIVDDALSEEKVAFEGDWYFVWAFNYVNNSLVYKNLEEVKGEINTYKLNVFTISPLSILVEAVSDGKHYMGEPMLIDAIILKDGTIISEFNENSSQSWTIYDKVICSVPFDNVINPTDIKSVVICGKEIVIN